MKKQDLYPNLFKILSITLIALIGLSIFIEHKTSKSTSLNHPQKKIIKKYLDIQILSSSGGNLKYAIVEVFQKPTNDNLEKKLIDKGATDINGVYRTTIQTNQNSPPLISVSVHHKNRHQQKSIFVDINKTTDLISFHF